MDFHALNREMSERNRNAAFSGLLTRPDGLIPFTLDSYHQFMISQAPPLPMNLREQMLKHSVSPATVLRDNQIPHNSQAVPAAYSDRLSHQYVERESAAAQSHSIQHAQMSPDRLRAISNTEDSPIDLSKPKSQQTSSPQQASVSQLARLLSRPRKRKSSTSTSNDIPLNLTKKPTASSYPAVSVDENSAIHMNMAVDNPVQLIRLADVSIELTNQKISELLVQMVQKIFSLQSFVQLTEEDKISLLLNSWHRLLLWLLAHSGYSFHISPLSGGNNGDKTKSKVNCPSMAFVKAICSFIQKYRSLQIDDTELSLLFSITLFHCGQDVCSNPAIVEQQRKALMQELQTHIMTQKNAGSRRFTDLLLYLPQLYGINEKMFEKLFCSSLLKENDIRLVLKDAIKRIPQPDHVSRSIKSIHDVIN